MTIIRLAALAASLSLVAQSALAAAPAASPPSPTTPLVSPLPPVTEIKIPEGTEFPMRLEESISSSTAQTGDRFAVSLDEDVKLPSGVILRAGYRGVGEVVEARENGMLGKTGKLNIRLLYLKVGDERVRLRANKGAQGDHRVAGQVVSLVLFWPVAPFIKGKNIQINKGTMLSAFSDQDTVLNSPLTPPPRDD